MADTITIIPVTGVGAIVPGDDVARRLVDALAAANQSLQSGDVLVVTHKIVSKAEGMVRPAPDELSYRTLVDDETVEVIRRRGALVIAKTRHGFICANAGVDRSNTEPGTAVLLPRDPDRSAHSLRMRVRQLTGCDVVVIISDTFGRPWRRGLTDVALGVSGIDPILDLRGTTDMHGRVLEATEVAVADELAAAADLAMGKASAIPAAVVRGVALPPGSGRAVDLVRPAHEDLFR